ncbi:HIT family protein [Nakamurella lactea]|uniref:HIT family protein n=1 Tax=Nakamurella lactea TaxID=459515 RepID=UPI00048C15E7|nr:HIT family protein [Nakamurella lactea]
MSDSCVFCDIIAGRLPAAFVIDEPEVLAFLDRRPVFPGHTLVVPREHHVTLGDLPTGLLTSVMLATQRISAAVPEAFGAQGSFVANNNIVSQSVPHLHFHVVPRTKGDGLRGFFWPRKPYDSDAQMQECADRLSSVLAD